MAPLDSVTHSSRLALPDRYKNLPQAHAYLRAADGALRAGKHALAAYWIEEGIQEAMAARRALGGVSGDVDIELHKMGFRSGEGAR
jgi:hypothetical protein